MKCKHIRKTEHKRGDHIMNGDTGSKKKKQKLQKKVEPWTWKHIKLLIERQTVTQNIVFLLLFPESGLKNGRGMLRQKKNKASLITVKREE